MIINSFAISVVLTSNPDTRDYHILIISIIVFFVVLIYSAATGLKEIFSKKDFNILIPMPIDFGDLILSKIIALYIFNLGSILSFGLPALIVYTLMSTVSIIQFFIGLFLLIIYPLPVMFLGIIISVILSRISIKFRYRKQVVVFFGVLLFALLYGSFFFFQEDIFKVMLKVTIVVVNNMKYIYPPSIWFNEAVVNMSYTSMALFIIVSLLIFAICYFILRKNYIVLYQRSSAAIMRVKKKIKFKSKGTMRALLKKEIQLYFSYPIFMFNTLFAPLLFTAIGIFLMFFNVQDYLGPDYQKILDVLKYVGPFVILSIVGISVTAYCALSIEGKHNWIVYSMPVKTTDIVIAKILLGMILVLPATILLSIAYGKMFNTGILLTLLTLLSSLTYSFYSNTVAIFIDYKFVNYEWTDPQYIVKGRLTSMLSVIANFGVMTIFSVIVFTFRITSLELLLLFIIIITISITLVIINYFSTVELYTVSKK